ncbi:hypothetical protein V6N12_002621 [Hibiscus sabdariffa]|uniref:DUF4283 domain-containing protein n=1 Tax=Hibiscus sabdariffa TaxID=183260 RepID=A0ABR2EB21_9ROSI
MRADILAKELHEQGKKHEEALGKWFSEVRVWVKELSVHYRRAWVACHRVSIHAWSEGKFGNIAALWGDIISIDERTLKPTSFYRAYFQILTTFPERIIETVELVIGSKVFKVFVSEIEPTFSSNSVWCEEAESLENCMSINSKENQRVNEDVGEHQNDSSGFSVENSGTNSSLEARETTCADVESRDAPFGFSVKSVSQEKEVPDIENEAPAVQVDLEGVKGGVDIRVEEADDIVSIVPAKSSQSFHIQQQNLFHIGRHIGLDKLL